MVRTLFALPSLEVIKKTAIEVRDDGCFGLAAQLAFYFLLSLFPALLFLVALIGYVPVDDALDQLLATLDSRRTQLGDLLATHLPMVRWRPPHRTTSPRSCSWSWG